MAAYFGGKVDEILMRMTDIVFAVPSLVLAMVIAAMLGPDIKNMMIALTAVAWPSYARLIRGDILSAGWAAAGVLPSSCSTTPAPAPASA